MTHLRIGLADEKNLRMTGLSGIFVSVLFEVPRLLEQRDQPPARDRLYPDPVRGDTPANEDWHRLMDDDLRHLFASAGETVERDLARLETDPTDATCGQLLVPVAHVHAWLSALNQSRLILGEQYAVTETDMTNEQLDPRRAKDRAVFKIHVLGNLLQGLVKLAGSATA